MRHPVTMLRIAAAVASARDSDVVIAVIGERETQSGEAKNRASLDLPGNQQALIDALLATGKPVVVVLLTGRALAVPELAENSRALVHAFFPGIEGGHAIADVLFGDYNPGGKQPMTWPRSVGQLPIHHYDPPNGRPNIPERGDYKAHWLDESDEPLFSIRLRTLLQPLLAGGTRIAAARRPRRQAGGAGARDQLSPIAPATKCHSSMFVRASPAAVAGKRLTAYQRVHLAARESRVVEFAIPASQLAVLGPDNRWQLEPGIYEVTVGTSARGGLEGTFELSAAARVAARNAAAP